MLFIILAYQRSGTHLLASLLNTHRKISCRGHSSIKHVEEIRDRSRNSIQGCVLMYSQFLGNKDSWNDVSAGLSYWELIKDAKVLHLMRKNLRNHAVSENIRRSKKLLGLKNHSIVPVEKRNISMNETWIQFTTNEIVRDRKLVFKNFLFHDVLDIYLEDLTKDKSISSIQNAESKRILDFLGVEDQKLTTHLFRTGFSDMVE